MISYNTSLNYVHDYEKDLTKLRKIFEFYSISNDYNHELLMNFDSFLIFLKDAKFINKNFYLKYAQIIFHSFAREKNFINFNNFSEILVKLSEIKYPYDYFENPKYSYEKLLVFILGSEYFSKKINNNKEKILKENFIDLDTERILVKFNQTDFKLKKFYISKHFYLLSKLYDVYFPFENLEKFKTKGVKNISNISETEKSFLKFIKDFDIYNLINLRKISDIFNEIISSYSELVEKIFTSSFSNAKETEFYGLENHMDLNFSNKGSHFTLFHFISALYVIAFYIKGYKNEYFTFKEDVLRELSISKIF